MGKGADCYLRNETTGKCRYELLWDTFKIDFFYYIWYKYNQENCMRYNRKIQIWTKRIVWDNEQILIVFVSSTGLFDVMIMHLSYQENWTSVSTETIEFYLIWMRKNGQIQIQLSYQEKWIRYNGQIQIWTKRIVWDTNRYWLFLLLVQDCVISQWHICMMSSQHSMTLECDMTAAYINTYQLK